jgi:hypothetical protein
MNMSGEIHAQATSLLREELRYLQNRMLDGPEGLSGRFGVEIFLFYKKYRPALGPIPPLIWRKQVTWRTGREADHSPVSSAEVKNEWSHTYISLKCFHGVVRVNFACTYERSPKLNCEK